MTLQDKAKVVLAARDMNRGKGSWMGDSKYTRLIMSMCLRTGLTRGMVESNIYLLSQGRKV